MFAAWAIEAAVGWPAFVYARIGHPVVWIGALVTACETALNRPAWRETARYAAGMAATALIVAASALCAATIAAVLPNTAVGFLVEAAVASSLLASRSLYEHVRRVWRPLAAGDLAAARRAVAAVVGRDPDRLDEAGVARAGLESLAENMSDGVVAPLFWGAILGLPGLAAYKAVNTLDSMIGHRSARYAAFGGFAARLDDVANAIPARLTGLLIAAASMKRAAFTTMARDAPRHRSPNAGWPEAAMAGALGVRLSGPRAYGSAPARPSMVGDQEKVVSGAQNENLERSFDANEASDALLDEPWLNAAAPDPSPARMHAGLTLYTRALAVGAVVLGLIALETAT
ncbi:MAG: adenosylcobinamide-phosphate synthase CbiB [Pseudomonadota bacterium]